MKKKMDKIIDEFEAALKSGKKPTVRDYIKRYGKLPDETIGTILMLQALYDSKAQMKLPDGFADQQRKLAQDLIAGKRPLRHKKIPEMVITDVPHPLTRENGPVPVVTLAAAGKGEIYEADVTRTEDGWEKITRPYDLPHKDVFAVEVRGDSLEPLIPAGSRAVVNTRKEPHSNSLALIIMQDFRACIKKIQLKKDKIVLISANPAYPPQEVSKKDIWKMYPVAWIRLK